MRKRGCGCIGEGRSQRVGSGVEMVEAGRVLYTLIGADSKRILQAMDRFRAQRLPKRRINPHGDGQASERIVEIVEGICPK